ncbi:MAG: hypothetical protein OJF48_000364 [Afipia sp.]|jgi:hypothetical protein|nr:MAG: hypothetical protein OJF48_000364 [Afipia sp.]
MWVDFTIDDLAILQAQLRLLMAQPASVDRAADEWDQKSAGRAI